MTVLPPPTYDHLLTGHFHQTAGYAVRRPSGSSDFLLFLTVSGRGLFTLPSGETHPALPGRLHLLPPHLPHDYRCDGPRWHFYWAHFQPVPIRPYWLPLLDWPGVTPRIVSGQAEPVRELVPDAETFRSLSARFRTAHTHASDSEPIQQLLALGNLELLLLQAHALAAGGRSGSGPQSSARARRQLLTDPRVASIVARLSSDPAAPLDVASLAASVSLSVSRLQHLFKEQTAHTLVEFAESQRIAQAKRLLSATSLSVKQIAADCGYASPFYFSLRFKRATGVSPSQYRHH